MAWFKRKSRNAKDDSEELVERVATLKAPDGTGLYIFWIKKKSESDFKVIPIPFEKQRIPDWALLMQFSYNEDGELGVDFPNKPDGLTLEWQGIEE